MPKPIGSITDTTITPTESVYMAGDVGKIELKEQELVVELVLSDEVHYSDSDDNRPIKSSNNSIVVEPLAAETLGGLTPLDSDDKVYTPSGLSGGPEFNPLGTLPPISPSQERPVPPLPDRNCITIKEPEEEPPDSTGLQPPDKDPVPTTSGPPKGRNFFDPECETCCHSPTDSPAQFYFLCLLISTDPDVTKMVESGLLNQVYGSISALQGKYQNGEPGAFLQETNFLEFTKQKIDALVNSNLMANPRTMLTTTTSPRSGTTYNSYQFSKKFSFRLPQDCTHLTLFTFIRLDHVSLDSYYGLPDVIKMDGVYTGPIKQNSVVIDSNLQTLATAIINPSDPSAIVASPVQKTPSGIYYTYNPTSSSKPQRLLKIKQPVGNIRSDKLLNKLKKVCSVSILEALQQQNNLLANPPQNKFWISRNSDSTHTIFVMYNYEQIIMENSFIKNLKSKHIYSDQEIQSVFVEKVDLLDESNNEIINDSIGIRTSLGSRLRSSTTFKNKSLPDQETISTLGGRVILSTMTELPSISRGIKMVEIIDQTPTSGRVSYRINLVFDDPSIRYLTSAVQDLTDKIDKMEEVYKSISSLYLDIKQGLYKPSKLFAQALDSAKSTIGKAISILNMLPNNEFNQSIFMNYMTTIANPKASTEDHDNCISVLRILQTTLLELLSNAGASAGTASVVGSSLSNNRNSVSKDKGIKTIILESQEFELGKETGIDFLTLDETTDSAQKSVYDTKFLSTRGKAEYSKFWDSNVALDAVPANTSVLREKSTFFLTPSKIYGVDEVIDFSLERAYGESFRQNVKKSKLAKEGKATKFSSFYTVTDSLENIPSSFQVVSADFDLFKTPEMSANYVDSTEMYLDQQNNFISSDLDTIQTKKKQAISYDLQSNKTLTELESTFVSGFEKMGISTIEQDINSNTSLESVVDQAPLNQLVPSLQAYKFRSNPASRMSSFVNSYGLLSDPSNQLYMKDYFGVVAKIQYAKMNFSDLNSVEWLDLDNTTLQTSRVFFCRFLPIKDLGLRLGTSEEYQIYNEYFVLLTDTSSKKLSTNSNNIRPPRSATPGSSSRIERVVSDRINSIMNQNTTYNTSVPISYTRIIH